MNIFTIFSIQVITKDIHRHKDVKNSTDLYVQWFEPIRMTPYSVKPPVFRLQPIKIGFHNVYSEEHYFPWVVD